MSKRRRAESGPPPGLGLRKEEPPKKMGEWLKMSKTERDMRLRDKRAKTEESTRNVVRPSRPPWMDRRRRVKRPVKR